MSGERLVVFDIESGGLDPRRHPITQLAAVAVDLDTWREVDAIEIKIRFNEAACEAEALKKHGYSPAVWAREGLAEPLARERVADFLRRHATLDKTSRTGTPYVVARLCGHNSRFDAEFLLQWFKRADQYLPAAAFEALDTLQLARWCTLRCAPEPEPADHKLGTLCAWCGIRLDHAHDALADVRATVALARALLERLASREAPPPRTSAGLHGLAPAAFALAVQPEQPRRGFLRGLFARLRGTT